MLAWLNANTGLVSGVASAVSAFAAAVVMCATIATVTLNRRLAKENRTLRKTEGDPQVVAYATINPRVWAAIDFVIANIGKGPARNVTYTVLSGAESLTKKEARLFPSGVKFAFLPSGEQLSSTMGMGWDLLSEPALPPFEVELTYENLAGEQRCAKFSVDVNQFNGMYRLGTPNDELIAQNLKKIADVMEGWSRGRLQVETMSVSERKEYDAEIRQFMQECGAQQD
ncbi:MAG: hypothetical protein JWN71_4382 [Xanthobacteraceae bacterium]|nr:hypothetical protein [Xanthobacteraceae bacterium]